jgi:hypothetical protein
VSLLVLGEGRQPRNWLVSLLVLGEGRQPRNWLVRLCVLGCQGSPLAAAEARGA